MSEKDKVHIIKKGLQYRYTVLRTTAFASFDDFMLAVAEHTWFCEPPVFTTTKKVYTVQNARKKSYAEVASSPPRRRNVIEESKSSTASSNDRSVRSQRRGKTITVPRQGRVMRITDEI